MGLERFRSIYKDDIGGIAEDYISRRPEHRLDTRIGQKVGVHLKNPILDTLLRPAGYGFVSQDLLTSFYKTEMFDPRVPKNEGITITPGTYVGSSKYPTNLNKIERYGAGKVFVTTDYIMDGGNPFTFPGQSGIGLYTGENNSKNQSWQNLYESNHSFRKDGGKWQGILPQH